jgi:hypothetical protein
MAGGGAAGCAKQGRGKGEPEVGERADMRAPADSECKREEGSAGAGGPRWFRGPEEERPAGFGWAARGRKTKKEKERWAGPRVEVRWVGFVFFFFFFPNPFQTLLNSHLLHVFKFKF